MQQKDGSMKMLDGIEDEKLDLSSLLKNPKVIKESGYFKIKRCYFKITKITPKGIEAKGVSKREYFENRK